VGTSPARSEDSIRAYRPRPVRRIASALPLLTVIVPTLNERDNVIHLVDRLIDALAGVDFEILFVDDSSDDTPQIILGLQREISIKLIHREAWEREGGLTTALTCGLRAARGTYISVLDGDLQHPPEKLRQMLEEAERTGADVVAASRYCKGGSASGLPGTVRRAVSLGSKWLSKMLFYERLRHASDPGSGFFLLRGDVIHGIELRPVGYKMLTEILVRGRWSRIAEVPYRFEARSNGASKAGLRQGVQYLQHTARIFLEVPHVARTWKFLAVGATGVLVNLGLLWASTTGFGLPRGAGWAVGVEASIVSNFWLNHTFTWRDRRSLHAAGTALEAARYHVSSAFGAVANLSVFTAASLFGVAVLAAGTAGIVVGLALNFSGASRFVFPARERPRQAPELLAIPLRVHAAVPAARQLDHRKAA
jgi:dolichol-phosphate mannosyltransferase